MGFNIGGIFKAVVKVALGIFKVVSGSDTKPTVTDLLPTIFTEVLSAVDSAMNYGLLSTKEQIDQWLDQFDAGTGTGGIDIISTMPDNIEEEMFDHLKEAVRRYAYNKAKVPGFYE